MAYLEATNLTKIFGPRPANALARLNDGLSKEELLEETGQVLDDLKLFDTFRRDGDLPSLLVDETHVFYVDADVPEEAIDVNEGQAFRYHAPADIPALKAPPHIETILSRFLNSAHYRAMFH